MLETQLHQSFKDSIFKYSQKQLSPERLIQGQPFWIYIADIKWLKISV